MPRLVEGTTHQRNLRESRLRREAIMEALRLAVTSIEWAVARCEQGNRYIEDHRIDIAKEIRALHTQAERVAALIQVQQLRSEEPGAATWRKARASRQRNHALSVIAEFGQGDETNE